MPVLRIGNRLMKFSAIVAHFWVFNSPGLGITESMFRKLLVEAYVQYKDKHGLDTKEIKERSLRPEM